LTSQMLSHIAEEIWCAGNIHQPPLYHVATSASITKKVHKLEGIVFEW